MPTVEVSHECFKYLKKLAIRETAKMADQCPENAYEISPDEVADDIIKLSMPKEEWNRLVAEEHRKLGYDDEIPF